MPKCGKKIHPALKRWFYFRRTDYPSGTVEADADEDLGLFEQ